MELSFRRWGSDEAKSSGKRLVFLHGMGGTGSLWRPVAASLEDRFDILSPDQRGHGGSRITATPGARETPQYTPLDYGRDVLQTLETLSFHPTWIIGHSMGVRTACATAYLQKDWHPHWVQGLVLIDLGFSGPAGGGLGDGLARFLRVLPEHFPSRAEARAFMEKNCPDPSIAQYLMAVSAIGPDGLTFPFDHGALIQTIEAARDISVRAWLESILAHGMPVLVLRGAKSLVWSHEEFEAERKHFAHFPNIEFREVADAGHGLPFEKRAEFVAMLDGFIAAKSK